MDAKQRLKRMLVFFGSPHAHGHTAELLCSFLSKIPGDLVVHQLDAYRENIRPCCGCGYCEKQDGCSMDDFDKIDLLLRQADYLVIATPVYNLSFPAPLKAIFDRTQRYFSARFSRNVRPPIQRPKEAVLLLTAGSDDPEAGEIILRQLRMMFTVMNTRLTGECICLSTDRGGVTGEKRGQAAALGERLCFGMDSGED